MAPQVSSLAQREQKDIYVPPELVLMVFEQVAGPDWPEQWFSMRAVCRMWKVEIEELFRKRYLQTMTLWAWPRSGNMFKYTVKAIPGERAVTELEPALTFLKWDLLQNKEILQTGTVLRVSAPDIGISQSTKLTELVDFRIDTEGNKILIHWLPMVNELFHRVCSQRKSLALM
ncbi:hypothetical protein F4782DRAFT_548871 [Xylaria castorea]|nr:hypothetical protein F4782DRAFT_548871 [Xylaria castorea]